MMKRLIWCLIFSALLGYAPVFVVSTTKSTEHQNVTYNVGRIVALGQCKSGECSYQYTDKDGALKYATTYKPVSLGQLVYQECWFEEAKGNRCYVDYAPNQN